MSVKIEEDTLFARTAFLDHRQWLCLALLGAAVFFLVPHLISIPRALRILGNAHPLFLMIAVSAELLRYFASASSTRVLGRLFKRVVPFEPMLEAFFAGGAANRTFSTGGAPGMIIRYLYLTKQQISGGQVAVIYLIEDIAGLVIGGLILLIGTITLAVSPSTSATITAIVFGFPIGSSILVFAALYLYNRRAFVEGVVQALARLWDTIAIWLINRPVSDSTTIHHAVDQFYLGMSTARRSPLPVIASFAFNMMRYVFGISAVYFCFVALGWAISPGALILIYTSASVLSTVSAVPGELAILGGSWAILTLSFGVPRETAMLALILSRTVAFWLPIPIGCLALWNLRRLGHI
jgi:uncharacterized protein (TIRG00374 family)